MCVKLANNIMRHKLNASAALVLRTLAIRQNHRCGYSWPTLRAVAFDSNDVSKSTAQRCISDLIKLGIVQKERRKVAGRLRPITIYIVRSGAETVVWDRRQTWRKFVDGWISRQAQFKRLAGESKADFVNRLSRLGKSELDS